MDFHLTDFHLSIAFAGQMVYTYAFQLSEHRQAVTSSPDCVRGHNAIGGRVMRALQHLGWALMCALAVPPTAMAQQSASISGVVTDATGGVIPGVTIEASSPVLIEKVRTAVSEGNGRYQFVDLRPGTYSVTFALQGVSTVRREGITLTAGFAASVNVELKAGAIAETITVSGSSPMVDVRNVAQTQVMTRDVLDNTPTARVIGSLMTLVPGVTITTAGGPNVDTGGTAGYTYAAAQIHGSSQYDQTIGTYGIPMVLIDNIGKSRINLPDGTVQEYDMRYSSLPAELAYGGFTVNAIPKVGGNAFTGSVFFMGTGSALHGSNLDDNLRAQGLTAEAKVKRIAALDVATGKVIGKSHRRHRHFHVKYRSGGPTNLPLCLTRAVPPATLEAMNVHLRPEQEAAISQIAADTGRQTDELVQEAVDSLLERDARFRAGVRKGIEQADRGEFIKEDDMEAVIEQMLQS